MPCTWTLNFNTGNIQPILATLDISHLRLYGVFLSSALTLNPILGASIFKVCVLMRGNAYEG